VFRPSQHPYLSFVRASSKIDADEISPKSLLLRAGQPVASLPLPASRPPQPGGYDGPAAYAAGVGQTDGVWDVAVIGAGPAGATAARVAAAAGRRVILLERSSLPRYKTCGGGLIDRSLSVLPPGMPVPARSQATAITFSFHGRLARTRRAPGPLITLVRRDEFDASLTDAAVAAGAVLLTGTVTGLAEEQEAVRLSTREHGDLRARTVVGADGSAGRCAGHVGVRFDQTDLGLELELPLPPGQRDAWADRVLIDWGPVPGSYAWVFPKGEQLSVGVIAARGRPEELRAYLTAFLARVRLDGVTPDLSSGHLTRCRAGDSPLTRGRVLVAGDAAGLLDPWSREGISFALRSGALAGQAAARASAAADGAEAARELARYADAVSAELAPEMRAGRAFLRAFRRHPLALHLALILVPPAWRLFARVISGRASIADIMRNRLLRLALAVLSA
jgi:geranylgeranyl reductase family protein